MPTPPNLVADVLDLMRAEALKRPLDFAPVMEINPLRLQASLELADKLDEPFATALKQWLTFGPIATLRPDSGQIEGKPVGYNFGTDEEPHIRYAFDDWPSEYKKYWEQRVENPQERFLNGTAPIGAMVGGNGVSKTTSLIAYAVAATLGMRPWLMPYAPDSIVRKPNGKRFKPPLRVAVFSDSFEKVKGVYFEQKLFRAGGWPKGDVEPIRDAVKVSRMLLWGAQGMAPDNMDLKGAVKNGTNGLPATLKWGNGSVWQFFSYAQASQAAESYEFDVAIFDEPPPRPYFIATLRGMRESGGRILMGLTPITEPWIQNEIIDEGRSNREYDVVIADSFSNSGNLSPGWIYKFWDALAPSEVIPRIFGRFSMTKGAEFDEFDDKAETGYVIDDYEIPASWPIIMGIDPHPSKPAEACWAAFRPDGGVEVLAQRQLKGAGVKEIIQEIEAFEATQTWKRNKVAVRVMDPMMGAQSHKFYGGGDEDTVLDVYANASPEGWIWDKPALKGPGSLIAGHAKMHELMRREWNRLEEKVVPRLRFFRKGCGGDQGLISAMSKYGWKTTRVEGKDEGIKTDKIRDGWWKDKIDPVRYIIVYDATYEELLAMAGNQKDSYTPQRFISKAGG